MLEAANDAARNHGVIGVWKVGESHITDMQQMTSETATVTSKKEFHREFKIWEEVAAQIGSGTSRAWSHACLPPSIARFRSPSKYLAAPERTHRRRRPCPSRARQPSSRERRRR